MQKMMRLNACLVLSIVLLFPLVLWAAADVQPAMYGIGQEIDHLKPYILDKKRFSAPANEKEILKSLERLQGIAAAASHTQTLEKPGFQQKFALLIDHLKDTKKNFSSGHKELARYELQASLQACISCHSQMPGHERDYKVSKAAPNATFEDLEFLFATREFTAARKGFESLILGYPKNGLKTEDLIESLNYLATIYVRMEQDPEGAEKVFEKIAKRPLPPFLQDSVADWIESVKKWQNEPKLITPTDQEVLSEARRILGSDLANPLFLRDRSNQINYLRVSEMLHEYLTQHPETKALAEFYYLLGICYLNLDHSFFFGFDHMYLRSCIKDFPRDPIAKKCYKVFEESIQLGYSGTSGTHIPFDVLKELNEYRDKVYKKGS